MIDHNKLIKERMKRINTQEIQGQQNAFRNLVQGESQRDRELREGRRQIVDKRLRYRLGELAYLTEGEQEKQRHLVERIQQRQDAQMDAISQRLAHMKHVLNHELALDRNRPENEKRILSKEKWNAPDVKVNVTVQVP